MHEEAKEAWKFISKATNNLFYLITELSAGKAIIQNLLNNGVFNYVHANPAIFQWRKHQSAKRTKIPHPRPVIKTNPQKLPEFNLYQSMKDKHGIQQSQQF